MSARSEATNLIKVGYSPSEVAEELGKTKRIAELIRLIVTSVGEGDLLLSEIYFSIPESRRQLYERIYEKYPERDFRSLQMEPIYEMFSSGKDDPIVRKQMTLGPDYGNIELKLYWLAKDSPHTDTYRFLRDLEMTLHRLIRKTLELSFPAHDDGWWIDGIPKEIRKRCQDTKEENAEQRLEAYTYTNLIDFKKIIDSNWGKFRDVLPSDLSDDKKKKTLLAGLQRVNEIRNGVMHPIKGIPFTQDDCKFVRELARQLRESRWHLPVRDKRFGKN